MDLDYNFPVFPTFRTGASICSLASGHTDVYPLGFTEVRVPGISARPGVQVSLGTYPHPLTHSFTTSSSGEFMLCD